MPENDKVHFSWLEWLLLVAMLSLIAWCATEPLEALR